MHGNFEIIDKVEIYFQIYKLIRFYIILIVTFTKKIFLATRHTGVLNLLSKYMFDNMLYYSQFLPSFVMTWFSREKYQKTIRIFFLLYFSIFDWLSYLFALTSYLYEGFLKRNMKWFSFYMSWVDLEIILFISSINSMKY